MYAWREHAAQVALKCGISSKPVDHERLTCKGMDIETQVRCPRRHMGHDRANSICCTPIGPAAACHLRCACWLPHILLPGPCTRAIHTLSASRVGPCSVSAVPGCTPAVYWDPLGRNSTVVAIGAGNQCPLAEWHADTGAGAVRLLCQAVN